MTPAKAKQLWIRQQQCGVWPYPQKLTRNGMAYAIIAVACVLFNLAAILTWLKMTR